MPCRHGRWGTLGAARSHTNISCGRARVGAIARALPRHLRVRAHHLGNAGGVARVLDVDATIVSTNKAVAFVIERTEGQLSPRQVAEPRQRLARLKFHPREALPNLTALSLAKRSTSSSPG